MTDLVRFDLGFVGGGSTSGTVESEQWHTLEHALASGQEVLIDLDEGSTRLLVRSSQVAWARVHKREARIGF